MNPDPKSLAVITGASAGIGRVFAERLAKRGHPLILIARDEKRLKDVAGALALAHGVDVRVMAADLAREDDIERVARALESENVGVLVNNAGFGTKGKFYLADIGPQMDMLRLHTIAPMRIARAVLPGMVERHRGWIINVSSIASFVHGPGNVNYCATKSYLTRFSQALDTELYDTGVVVQALCPGFTHSEFHDRMKLDKRDVAPKFLWSSAARVVDLSIAAAARGGPVVFVPGIRNKILTFFVKLAPQFVLRRGRQITKRV